MCKKSAPPGWRWILPGVEFMDSSGIGLVLGRYRLMQEMNGKLVLRAMPPHIRRVMRVAGIASLEIEEESRV